jgi:hypothetical protein
VIAAIRGVDNWLKRRWFRVGVGAITADSYQPEAYGNVDLLRRAEE